MFDKFNEINDEQFLNVPLFDVICEISKFDLFNDNNEEKVANTSIIELQFEAARLVKLFCIISE